MWLAELRTDTALWPRQATRCAPLPHNFGYRFNGYSNRLSDDRWGSALISSASPFTPLEQFPSSLPKDAKAYLPQIILKSGSWAIAYLNMEKAWWTMSEMTKDIHDLGMDRAELRVLQLC